MTPHEVEFPRPPPPPDRRWVLIALGVVLLAIAVGFLVDPSGGSVKGMMARLSW